MTDPVALDEAKAFLRVTHGAEDGLIAMLLQAAKTKLEEELGRALSGESPAPLRLAVMILAAHAFDGRGDEPPRLDTWIAPYRTVRL